ncbi:MAG: hypothetical protein ACM3YE_08220 [Bacteroidota bacterium]
MKIINRIRVISSLTWRQISIVIILSILIGGCLGHNTELPKIPAAKKGVLDLRGWNFEKNGPMYLDGDWEFYWNQLLKPTDFTGNKAGGSSPRLTGVIRVPGSWQGYQFQNKKLTGNGFATYRLKLLLPDTDQSLAVNIPQLLPLINSGPTANRSHPPVRSVNPE